MGRFCRDGSAVPLGRCLSGVSGHVELLKP